eukprot:4437200-Amphidinium_carterae.1
MAKMTLDKALNILEHKTAVPAGLTDTVHKLMVRGNSTTKKHQDRISKRSLRGDTKHTNLMAEDPEEDSYGNG